MDLWDFKKWRRQLRYTQSVAAEKLGLSRGAIQYWEAEIRPVPLAVELACKELQRLWKQQPAFGPVTLFYADEPRSLEEPSSVDGILVQFERHPNNESALRSAARSKETVNFFIVFILEDDGNVIRSGPELLREIDARKSPSTGEETPTAKTPSSK